jgi:hypothetical protein
VGVICVFWLARYVEGCFLRRLAAVAPAEFGELGANEMLFPRALGASSHSPSSLASRNEGTGI